MSSSFVQETPSTPSSDPFSEVAKTKQKLIRTNTTPVSTYETPPKTNELHRQMSASPSLSTPVNAISSYLKQLLGMNAKITKRSLSEEAECGSPESLGEWLRQGSDPNEIDPYGYTPLVNASLRGCTKSVKILINNGADVNMKAIHGYCPLHAASQNGYTELADTLIDNGADTEVKNEDGDTPLMLAVRSEHAAVVDLLCKRGCNMHTHGFDNIEPIDYAINKRNLYLSDVLMKHERQNLSSSTSVNESHNQKTLNHSHDELAGDLHHQPNQHEQSLNVSDSVFQSD